MNAAALFTEFRALPNLYEYMGVVPEVDDKTLKKAYRTLTLKYHPDLNPEPGASEMFIVLKRAHEILENRDTRVLYDRHLEELKQKKLSRETISEKRKYFSDLLRKREEEARGTARPATPNDQDLVNEYLKKKRMTRNVETIYEDFGQKEINEVLEAQKREREQLKKSLATLKVKWMAGSSKSYSRVLMRMIFGRFGNIEDIDFLKDQCKCYIQYSEIRHAEAAMKYMQEHSDFKIKFLVNENREKHLEKTNDKTSGFELNSDNLNKISGLYNGYSYTDRRSQLDREIERQRQIKVLIDQQMVAQATPSTPGKA